MAGQPKHIQIARKEGPEAGLEAYLGAPSSRIHDAYKEIARKRTQASKLKTYCTIFADQIGPIPQDKVQADRAMGDVQVLAERLAMILKGEQDEPEAQEPEYPEAVVTLAETLGVEPSVLMGVLGVEANGGTTRKTDDEPINTSTEFITRDAAWAALGRGVDRPQPSNRGGHATNAQLWRMNGGNGEFPTLFTSDCIEFVNGLANES